MNRPPEEFTPVRPEPLRDFIRSVYLAAGMPAERAELITSLLVKNDLRGVFSHGTRQTRAYVSHFRKQELTPAPEVQVVRESPTTLVVDGGGGLGYFPAWEAAHRACEKARAVGIAAALTRNHGHIGAAGIYTRVAVEQGLFGYITSGHQLHLHPGQPLVAAAGGSPHSFAIPAGDEPPFVLDFGAVHDMYPGSPHLETLSQLAPGTVFRSIGMGTVCQAMGGFLAGVPVDPARAQREWSGANQGSFFIAVDLAQFCDPAAFRAEMDEYLRKVRELKPLTGFDRAVPSGGMEHLREQEYAETGIPVGAAHADALRFLAEEFGLQCPV